MKIRKILFIFALLFSASSLYGQEMGGDWDYLFDGFNDYDWKEHWQDEEGSTGDSGATSPYIVVLVHTDTVTMMTYNLWRYSKSFDTHKLVINGSGAHVVALQEMYRSDKFEKLKKETGMSGVFCVLEGKLPWTIDWMVPDYGIALLWHPWFVGNPTITGTIIAKRKGSTDPDDKRAYIVAEFRDFCFVATHFSLDEKDRDIMASSILAHSVVKKCISSGKPIYLAGDFNATPYTEEIKSFIDDNFEVLNDTYESIDLILGHNKNTTRETLESKVPSSWMDYDQYYMDVVSDHRPYFVKVKLK